MIKMVCFSIQKSIFAGNSAFPNRMNTDWTRKARDSEGEKYLEKAIRLDKYLADMGKGTRTELKEMIRKGRITVNGVIVKKPETKIKKGEDTICLDNAPVEYVELEYYL